jgi:drug/metabolite transporter (DMT)-like permease
VGATLAIGAIAAIAFEPGAGSVPMATGALFGAGAGLGFGIATTVFSTTSASSGFWPLAGSRLGPVVLVGIACLARRVNPVRGDLPVRMVIAAGLGDVAATALVFLAFQQGMTSIVAPVSAIYPAVTVVLARVLLDERIGRTRIAGLAVAASGLGLLGVR